MRAADLTLQDLLRRGLRRGGGQPALRDHRRSLTYDELDAASDQLAAALQEAGVGPGVAVALYLRNGVEFVVADLAIVKLGAVKVPLNELLAAEDVGAMLVHAGARVLIFSASLGEVVDKVADRAPLRLRIEVDDLGRGRERAAERWEDVLASAPAFVRTVRPAAPGDPGLCIYTGGTTGRSKGVVHLQEALALNLLSHLASAAIGPDDHLLIVSPLPHSAQLMVQAGLLAGARVRVVPRFDPAAVLDLVAAEGITWTFLVPTMIYRLLDELALRPRDTASLRTIVYGAAPITARRLRQGLDALGPVFLQIYGQTEAPNFLTTLAKRDHLRPELHGSCGQPVLLADIAIRRPDGALALPGEAGEVVARSPYTLERYHDDPERTAEAYDGAWLRTGDLGYLDEAGYLFLVDRAKDMIISGGMNVYSSEVENAVQEHPGVRQVVVIGIPHDDWGEAVHAVVVPADGAGPPVTEAQLIAHCRDRLARYKVPKSVEFVETVPVTAYGKPDKKALRARHWADQERAVH